MSFVLAPSIQEAFALVEGPLRAVKNSLGAIIPPDSMVLADTVKQSLGSGGKYMRPAVTVLATQATGSTPETEEALVEAAAVTEMIHVATLLHDDVIDDSELRRGQRTVRAQLGNKISVLSGDYLLAQASVKLARLENPRLVSIFAHVLADLCDGEVEQLHTSYTLNTSWDSYYKKTICKTASLFSAGCESAGVLNRLPEAHIQQLRAYGRNFGIAFQIVDDLLDYTATEAEMGKPVLDDLRNGLMNAPVLLALESEALDEAARGALTADIQRLFEDPQEATIARIREALDRADALNRTRALAEHYVQEACRALDFVPDSPQKRALVDLVHFITERRQ